MKKVKVKFVGFWPAMKLETQFMYQILSKHYNVEISEEPDYVICSCFDPLYEYCKYPQVRIMIAGENYIPDFNFIDYAICYYPVSFFDRCFYKPGCYDPWGHALALENVDRNRDRRLLDKKYFANFIASHESENGLRGGFFKALSKYKRIESPGSYLNNMSKQINVSCYDDSKTDFQRQCKFTLCFESTKHEGFVTEKITDAFYAETIPIYYGSDSVSEIFNPKAFINISDFDSWAEAIEFIKKIDNDDDLYLDMLSQPILNEKHYFSKLEKDLEEYILHIFEQPIEEAYRRSRVYAPKKHEEYLLDLDRNDISKKSTRQLLKVVFNRARRKVGS